MPDTARATVAEGLGTTLLLSMVVGSGIMGERLAGGNTAIALLANTIATGTGLGVLIVTFAQVSGAHFNPVVTLVAAARGGLRWPRAASYLVAQFVGACCGVVLAHAMFGEALVTFSVHARTGIGQVVSEFVATFGLVTVIHAVARYGVGATALSVGAYITSAYWFTASTSFANPAVTIARSLTDTFAGIRPADVPAFVIAQFAGAMAALLVSRWLRVEGRESGRRDVQGV